ncbi:acrosomal protein SP-10-like [Dromiciops gliroides]|uniref:acrosomal protein SP-10-like n=1 Tax=Dromiciops gliroides TaxID=33562 RepID=UPI001CC77CE8|nr:acrosomal protein SP-10-like [Dromiciops gliroides]
MDKMFLLGLILFCLLQGEESKFAKKKEVLCSTCERFKQGKCMKNEGTCITKAKNGCRSQSVYEYAGNTTGFVFSHAKMECVEKCEEKTVYLAWYRLINACCSDFNLCNLGYSLA